MTDPQAPAPPPTPAFDEAPSWRPTPLVPEETVSGRSLMMVIAIMTFLAALAAGFALSLSDASTQWRSEVGREMTVQILPRSGRDIEADVRKATEISAHFPGVASAQAYSRADSEALLAPWLGAGLDLSQLPTPRLIALRRDADKTLDSAALRQQLDAALPNAALDDHGAWMRRLDTMALVVVGAAAGVFALVLAAQVLAVGFATRGAMAGARDIIETLHFVGAADKFIARQFQLHFLRLGLRGAAIGGGAAIALFFALGALSRQWALNPGGEQAEALFGSFSLGLRGAAIIAALSVGSALLAGLTSRNIVYRSLRGIFSTPD